MLGAIAGDIIGSVHEYRGTKTTAFELFEPGCCFTDDTILNAATADSILNGVEYVDAYRRYYERYPDGDYGLRFREWARSGSRLPYGSWGNGSAMRVAPIGFAFATWEETLAEAERSAAATHDHVEGIRGAQATAAAIFLARHGESKSALRRRLETTFGYDLRRRLDGIRADYRFDESCAGTVPPALIAFLESSDYEGAIRNAISLGGDADTLACITGGIAEAAYGVPQEIEQFARDALDEHLIAVVDAFRARYGPWPTP